VNALSGVDSVETNGATTILLRGSATPTFTVYKLDNPERVVVDLSNAELSERLAKSGDGKVVWQTNTWAVSNVAGYPSEGSGRRVRVVVSLARAATYKVRAIGHDVEVRVSPRDKAPAAVDNSAAREQLEAQRRAIEAQRQATREEARRLAAARAEAEAAAKTARIERERAEKLVRDAETMRAQAKAEVAEAHEQVRTARSEAEQARVKAREHREQADARLAEAKKMMTEANARLRNAEKAQAEAATAKLAAQKRESAARGAHEQALQAKRTADTARARAEESQARADEARARGQATAELERRAKELAVEAERQQRAAIGAAAVAKNERAAAESAARNAQSQEQRARAERTAAEEQRKLAEAKRAEADKARLLAEERRRAAEKEASMAEKRVEELRSTLAQIKEQVERSKTLRTDEEKALARAAKARQEAESRHEQAAEAAARVEASMRAIRDAESKAQQSKVMAERAKTELERYRARSNAEKTELDRLHAQAAAMAAARDAAGKELEAQRTELAARKRLAQEVGAQRDAAVAHLAELRKRTESATARRQAEEQRLSVLADKRKEAELAYDKLKAANAKAEADRAAIEKELAEARVERAAIERKLAAAESRFSQIEKDAEATLSKTQDELAKARREADAIAERHKALVDETRKAEAKLAQAKSELKRGSTDAKPRVHEVDYQYRADASRVVLGLSSPAEPRVVSNRGRRAVLLIPNVSISSKLERTIDASRFGGSVRAVSAYRDPSQPTDVKVVVDLDQPTKGVLKRVGNTYYWDFANSEQVASAKKRTTRAASYPPPVIASAAASAPITQSTVSRMRGGKVYRGRPIDLDFKDADIHNLLRLLADVGGVNIVIPDEIKASVTVRLRRVPWDQAMEVILASKGLWYRREGDLIRVAPRKELDAEDKEEAERRKALAQSEPPEPEVFTLNYAVANKVRPQLVPLLSPKGKIQFDARTNSLIINDVRANRRRILDLVRRLDTQTPQIQIEARIVEARTTFVREFGIQWGGNGTASAATGNATGLLFPSSVAVAGAANDGQTNATGVNAAPTDFAVNLPAGIGSGSGGGLGFAFGSVGGNFNLNLRLSALEDIGTARIVSSPKITVINNVQASISQGVSIPISVVSANGVQTQFVPADLSLRVTPHVSQRDCSITMDVNVSKNEPDFANTGARGDPSILRREAKTTIIVADGETTVIGGIYTRNTGRSYNKVPFLAELPVIGLLFKNRRDTDERAEVLVFLTPKITNRAFLQCE